MHGRDVRREHRQADDRPPEIRVGEKVVTGLIGARIARTPDECEDSDTDDDSQIDDNDDKVNPAHVCWNEFSPSGKGLPKSCHPAWPAAGVYCTATWILVTSAACESQ